MPWWVIVILVVVFVMVDVMIIAAVFAGVKATLSPMVALFPPVEPRADAVSRSRQGFSFGMCNYGGCFTVHADEAYLHLRPNVFGRLFGAPCMSVPWGKVTPGKRKIFKTRAATFGGHDVVGPAWCIDLAEPTEL